MRTAYESFDPVDARLVATLLQEKGITVRVHNEASFLLGYVAAMGPVSLVVADADFEAARKVLTGCEGTVVLPEDPEFVHDENTPEPISPWELGVDRRTLGRCVLFAVGAVVVITIMLLLGDLIGLRFLGGRLPISKP